MITAERKEEILRNAVKYLYGTVNDPDILYKYLEFERNLTQEEREYLESLQ